MKRYLPEILLLGAALALRLVFAGLPLNLLFRLLEDDAWMVAAIARNWAWGRGITADGLNPTNGFHPLYPLTLGALPYLLPVDTMQLGFRVNLLICAVLNTLALMPFYSLARALSSRYAALTGLAILALNPFLIRVSVNAMETSLALLLLLLLWWYALVYPPETVREALFMGLLAALAVLARLDNAVAVATLGLWLLWREIGEERFPKLTLGFGIATGVLLLPYFANNMLRFGSFAPSSGRALSYMHSFRESFAFTSGLQLVAYQPAFDLTWAPAWLLLLGLVLMVWIFLSLHHRQRSLLLPLVLYALALTFYYAYIQQQGQPRYYVAVAFVVVLIICARSMTENERRITEGAGWGLSIEHLAVGILAVGLNSTFFVNHIITVSQASYQAQPAMYNAARWIARNLPPDAVLAAQNSGIFQYYSERVVLNIDGKLNHEIIPVLERRELDVYLRSKGVQYLVDLRGVAGYVEFYSRSMSRAKPHAEMSTTQKLLTYMRLILARVRLVPPVQLDERVPEQVIHPFTSFVTVVQQFPFPNDPGSAVIVYRLNDDFGTPQP